MNTKTEILEVEMMFANDLAGFNKSQEWTQQ